MKTLVLNFYGGPSTGKSTTCAGVFTELKLAGVNCEMSREWAKKKVWEGSGHVLEDQCYVFGKQYHKLRDLVGKVDIALTDAPLLNSILYYGDVNPHFAEMVTFEHKRLNNFNILLGRVKPFNPSGRLQDEAESKALDVKIHEILDNLEESYFEIPAVRGSICEITNMALRRLKTLNGD